MYSTVKLLDDHHPKRSSGKSFSLFVDVTCCLIIATDSSSQSDVPRTRLACRGPFLVLDPSVPSVSPLLSVVSTNVNAKFALTAGSTDCGSPLVYDLVMVGEPISLKGQMSKAPCF